ncbi:hypothetical protein AGMMS49983_10000 [Clostridia bacterium]|nr:hypothetical protein AGMMS49983_10000 [Clostridia bacterium]
MNTTSGQNEISPHMPGEDIKDLILTIRGTQVLLDSDVARLYGYETKAVNQAASRNKKRFPPEFRFQLTNEEVDALYHAGVLRSQIATANDDENLKSQFVTSSSGGIVGHGGDMRSQIVTAPNLRSQIVTSSSASNLRSQIVTANVKSRYLPYAYTEQGIGMLSGLLRNDTAIQVSIGIMNAFVEMRKILSANRYVFERISDMDNKLIEHDHALVLQGAKIDEILALLNEPETNKQWIFYKGQFYDAYGLVIDLFKRATNSIIVIDNYADDSILEMLTKKRSGVSVTIITFKIFRLTPLHLRKFANQYGSVTVAESKDFHDRFIIIDENEVYALGASIKDLGNKCFEISKNEDTMHFIRYVKNVISASKTAVYT